MNLINIGINPFIDSLRIVGTEYTVGMFSTEFITIWKPLAPIDIASSLPQMSQPIPIK